MKQIIIFVIIISLLGCQYKSNNVSKNADSEYSDVKLNTNPENKVLSKNDVITPDSILINGKLPFRLTREELFNLMDSPFEIKKEWEASATYDSENDTLEYIKFKNENIVYVYANGRVEFLNMTFDNKENSFNTNKITINSKTTYEELCSHYPKSCENSSYNPKTKERIVRFYPAYNFFESTEFWAITFKEDKINEIAFVILD